MRKFLISKKKSRDSSPEPSTSTQKMAISDVSGPSTEGGFSGERKSTPEASTSAKGTQNLELFENKDTSSPSENTEDTHTSKKSKFYTQKYKPEWEQMEDFKWIERSERGNNYFRCKICLKDYLGGMGAIKKHNNSKIHKEKAVSVKGQPSVTSFQFTATSDKIIKQTEIRIAAFIAEHNISINTSDHLTELIKSIVLSGIEPAQIRKLTCGRTKCTALINNVIGKTNFENLLEKLKTRKFSLLVDESTDNSAVKHLAIVVRYNENFKIKDEFLTLIPVASATAQNLYNLITNFFNQYNVPYKQNLVGFGADGANTMMGNINSLKTLLIKDIPHLFVMKCICHSLALCASYACQTLPDEVEKLVRTVYTYMQHSFKRKSEFQEFQTFLNVKPHKILHPSQTRWLSLNNVVRRVLEQFESLKLYFRAENYDSVSGAAEIYDLLNNPINKLYLEFLEFILPTFNDLNLEFQAEAPKIHLLYSKMATAIKLLLSYYIKPKYLKNTDLDKLQYRNPEYYVSIEQLYLGPKIAVTLANDTLPDSAKHAFRLRCLNFYIEAAHQIFQRFPFNSREAVILKSLNFLNPSTIANVDSLGPLIIHFPNLVPDINDIDREFRSLKHSTINFGMEELEFWKEICNSKKADDTLLYPQLSQFVNILFVLPHSSACVERVFSSINLNKTKQRNRLSSETLTGILHSKNLILPENCFDFVITDGIVKNHNNKMYD